MSERDLFDALRRAARGADDAHDPPAAKPAIPETRLARLAPRPSARWPVSERRIGRKDLFDALRRAARGADDAHDPPDAKPAIPEARLARDLPLVETRGGP